MVSSSNSNVNTNALWIWLVVSVQSWTISVVSAYEQTETCSLLSLVVKKWTNRYPRINKVSKNHSSLFYDKILIDLFVIKTGFEEQFYWTTVKRSMIHRLWKTAVIESVIESELVIKTRQDIMIIAELNSFRPSLLLLQKTLCKRARENYQEYAWSAWILWLFSILSNIIGFTQQRTCWLLRNNEENHSLITYWFYCCKESKEIII